MFGFITVDKDTLTPKNYAYFNSFYCGLCMALKKRYGNKARLLNNFDCAFLFVFLTSYKNLPILIERKNCVIHLFNKTAMLQLDGFDKRNVCDEDIKKLEEVSTLANTIADIIVLLTKGKILDNALEKGKEKNSLFFGKIIKKAEKFAPNIDRIIVNTTKKIYELEKNNASVESLATKSGDLLSEICQDILNEDSESEVCKFFFELGKWIYYIDAICDLETDYKRKNFNPFINHFKDYTTRKEFVSKHKFDFLKLLNESLEQMQQLYNSMKTEQGNPIVENIIFMGLKKQQEIILTNPNKKLNI